MPLPRLSTMANHILMDGERLVIRGVSWFGFEGAGAMVDGLWVQPMAFFVRFVAAQGFNALRIPLAADHIAKNPKIKPDMCTKDPAMLELAHAGGRYLDAVERLVILAAHAGLLVILDMHRLEANVWPDPDGLWYRVAESNGRTFNACGRDSNPRMPRSLAHLLGQTIRAQLTRARLRVLTSGAAARCLGQGARALLLPLELCRSRPVQRAVGCRVGHGRPKS